MDFDFTKEQKLLKSSAQEFLKKECPTSLIREMKTDERGYSLELWKKMTELGWLGMGIPEEYGGIGGNFLDLMILLEAMGEACLPGPFFSTVVTGSLPIVAAGSKEQKDLILPGIADGKLILSLALTEPANRYGTSALSTSAIAKNDDYIINGTKLLVENAHIADYLLVLARVDDGKTATGGLTLFLVEGSCPGLSIAPLKTLAFDKLSEVTFDNVRVPKGNILGKINQAGPILVDIQDQAAVAKCADILGGLKVALRSTVNYAKQRKQFGRAIGSFQVIQHYCAEMQAEFETSMVIAYQAAWKMSEGMSATLEASMAKAWIDKASRRLLQLGHQIHGAIGFCEETDLHLYYRRARSGTVMYGDEDYHLEKVACEIGL